jgi:hypothetical protein
MWPGSLYLWRLENLESENQRLKKYWSPAQRKSFLFIGTNTCGIVFALDRAGGAHIFDEIESGGGCVDCGVALASSFATLLSSAHLRESARQRRARLMRYWRGRPGIWRRLEAVVVKPNPPTVELSALVDVREWAEELGEKEAFNEHLERLCRRMSRRFKTWLRNSGWSFVFRPIE